MIVRYWSNGFKIKFLLASPREREVYLYKIDKLEEEKRKIDLKINLLKGGLK